ncbi:MAG: hypothetical protein GY757_16525 [bacterium]|nr:hypothetical protein [bacterium]
MFCPQCKCEYLSGVYECSDCDVKLVPDLDVGDTKFCPQCKCEYLEGIEVCADCNIKLVHQLQEEPEPENNPDDLVDIGSFSMGFVSVIIEELLDAGIDVYPMEYPMNGVTQVMVRQEDLPKVAGILESIHQHEDEHHEEL